MESDFSSPYAVQQVIQQMLLCDQPRAINRARINAVFNGEPPYTAKEQRDNRIFNNINFLEGTRIVAQARSQFSNAFLKPGYFFTARYNSGPQMLRKDIGTIVTEEANRVMKKSPKYYHVLENIGANFVLHGPAPVSWIRVDDWCPVAKGVEDLLVPSRTLTDLSNLTHFAVFCEFSIADLIGFIQDPKKAKNVGWNVEILSKVIESMAKTAASGLNTTAWDYDFPEKVVENFKADLGYWGSDAAPVLRCYDFYYMVEGKDGVEWRRKIVTAPYGDSFNNMSWFGVDTRNKFILDSKKSYGSDISQMIHVLIGDGAVKAPFRYHSVRSLGYLMYAICHLQNRLRCKFADAVFESMMWYFRNVADGDGERLEKIDLHHLGVIPEGLEWVPRNERHQVDFATLDSQFTMNRQLMAESSSSFVQDPQTQTSKEMTATETMARINNSSALMGSMLSRSYLYMGYQQRECVRRLFVLGSKDCKEFRKRCMERGVPKDAFDIERWDIEPERVLGAGNKTLEIAQSQQLMAIRPLLDPESQRIVLRDYVLATTDDPARADLLVPLKMDQPNEAKETATLAWGTLIDGKPVIIAGGINYIDYVETLLQLLNMELGAIEQSQQVPDQRRIMGLANVVQNIEQAVQQIAQDEQQGERVKQYMDILTRANNLIRAYAQRAMEQQPQQPQGDPAALAKAQEIQLNGQLKRQEKEQDGEQRRLQKEIAFLQEQERKTEETQAQIARTNALTAAQIEGQVITAQARAALQPKPTPKTP